MKRRLRLQALIMSIAWLSLTTICQAAGSHETAAGDTDGVAGQAATGVSSEVAARTSSSLRFSGTVDTTYDRATIQVDQGASANIGASDFTIEVWLRPDATQNNGSGGAWWMGNIFLDRDILGNGERGFGASLRDGRVTFMTTPAGGSQTLFTASSDIRDDAWHWIVITYDRDTGRVQIYVDGAREANATGSSGELNFLSSSNVKNRLIELGGEKHFQGTPSYVGYMTELRFSNVVRYTGNSIAVPTAALGVDGDTVGYWSFSEGSGGVLTDTAGSTNGAVIFGGSPQAPVWTNESPYSGGGGGSAGVIQFNDVASDVNESDTNTSISVVRSGGSSGAATVNVASVDGTASAGEDYQSVASQLTWNDGEQGVRNVQVGLLPDAEPEANESFSLALAAATGASLGANTQHTVTILDDDVAGMPGVIRFADPSFVVNEAAGQADVTLVRDGGTTGSIAVDFSTADGTALAGSDYSSVSETVSFNDGEAGPAQVSIPITDDGDVEGDETVALTLAGGSAGSPANATLTITDNDAPLSGTLQFADGAVSVAEDASRVSLTVSRTGGASGAISASYASSDDTAAAGSDYVAASGNVDFDDGESADVIVEVLISDDSVDETNESFTVTLTGANVGAPATTVVTIIDNDSTPVPPPLPNPQPSSSSGSGSIGGLTVLCLLPFALRRFRAAA